MKILSQKILDAADIIAGKSRRSRADQMIVSKELADTMIKIFEEQEHRERVKQRRLKIEKLKNGIKKS